ncbi:MAG: NAD-dependent epimerase/dehydratase [Solirubrobacterales bacterium]|nr:NAD-dependent epimerase/dehydratase [Solirubrobacterales bacterium]
MARDGHRVTIYSRSFSEWLFRAHDERIHDAIRLVEGEVPPGGALTEHLASADIVFYMAGSSTPAAASTDPGGSMARHVVPAAAVLDLMRETDTRRIVISSSGGTVYGAPTTLPTPEHHPTRPISLHGHHSLTIERYAEFFAEKHGFETTILRFSNPYGPGQVARRGHGVIAAWSEAILRDEPVVVFGETSIRRDFLFIDDLVAATVRAAFDAPAGTYNVGSGDATRLQEIIDTLKDTAGHEVEVERVERRAVDVPVTQLDYSKLENAVGWRPSVSIADGIERSWEWARTVPFRREG